MPTAQELLTTLAPLKARSTRYPHPWEEYAEMIYDDPDCKGTIFTPLLSALIYLLPMGCLA